MTTNNYEVASHCSHCSKPIIKHYFSLRRITEVCDFYPSSRKSVVECELLSLDEIAEYCSESCLDLALEAAMSEEGIPLTQEAPDMSPVERCSACGAEVDMRGFHTIYQIEKIELWRFGMRDPEWCDPIAIVCIHCAPGEDC